MGRLIEINFIAINRFPLKNPQRLVYDVLHKIGPLLAIRCSDFGVFNPNFLTLSSILLGYHRMRLLAQVSPPPNAVRIIKSPF